MGLIDLTIPDLPVRRGKVRDVYELDRDRLLIVATDRISAYDWILPTPIPDKGRILTALSTFWFRTLTQFPNHWISSEIDDAGLTLSESLHSHLVGRSMIVRKVAIFPYECVVRRYLYGSAWREYRDSGTIGGEPAPPGWLEGQDFGAGRFTPSTKAEQGHDVNVSFNAMHRDLGDVAVMLKQLSREVFDAAYDLAYKRGLILADTKFEWGRVATTGAIVLADEILTPDSSRFWPADGYEPRHPQPSFDKQFVREWLDASGWDKLSPPPPLPDEIVRRTRSKYVECYEKLAGEPFSWK